MRLNFSIYCSSSGSKSLFRKIYIGLISFIFFFASNLNCFSQQSPTLADDIKKSIDNFIQKGTESEMAKDYNQASFFYHQAGNAYWSHDKLNEAIDLFKRSLAMSEQLSNFNGMVVLNTKIGLLYTEISNYESSLIYFTKSLEIARKINRKSDLVSSLLNVANAYFELDKYNEAIPLLIEAENLSKDLADSRFLRNCYSIMTNVYDKVGDRERSTQYFNLFAALTKKIQQDEIAKKESEARLMVDMANSKVQEVETANEATQLKLNEKSRQLFAKQIDLNKAEQISMEQQLQIDIDRKSVV
jgi:two-component system, sensor histidine kinase and response regulator